MKIDFELFRKNVLMVRAAKGLNGFQLSEQAKLHQRKRVHDIEEGRGKPTLEEVAAICRILEVSIDDMLFKTVEIQLIFKQI